MGWGGLGGSRCTPTYMPQNDRLDTLIIYTLGDCFQFCFVLATLLPKFEPVLVLRLQLSLTPPQPPPPHTLFCSSTTTRLASALSPLLKTPAASLLHSPSTMHVSRPKGAMVGKN